MKDKLPPRALHTRPPGEDESIDAQCERLTLEVLKIWGGISDLIKRIDTLEKEADYGRSELPSYTSLSFRPTGARMKLQNWKPSSAVLIFLIAAVAGVVAAWLHRR